MFSLRYLQTMKRRTSAMLMACLVIIALYSIRQIFLSNNIKFKQGAEVTLLPSTPTSPITCDRSHYRYDICSLNGKTLIDPTISTVHLVSPTTSTAMEKLRPYPRKWENDAMSRIRELTLISARAPNATCTIQHRAPAIVFSTGGYTGNIFHDFNDALIPLFITTRHLLSGRQDRDVVLVIANCHSWWLTKYAEILHLLTRHPIICLENETSIPCFPSATVGLISHGFAAINPSMMPNSESLADFRTLLDCAYRKSRLLLPPPFATARPRLVLVARNGSSGRLLLNQNDVVQAAEVAGFEVSVFTPTALTSLREAYQLINSSHVLLGVHGAALTHAYFLRPGAVLIQVVPLGLEWASEVCYAEPARQLGVEYMEYKIRVEESSLLDKYERNDMVLTNPRVVVKRGWSYTKIYLKNQDVKLDLDRVSMYLKAAYNKAKRMMEIQKQA